MPTVLCQLPSFPHFHQLQCIPDLVVEIASLFQRRFIKEDVIACRRGDHDAEAHGICTVDVDKTQQVGRVAQALAHLPALLVAHDTGKVYLLKWLLFHEFETRHDHARHPEEDDLGGGHQGIGGVVVLHFFVTRVG